MVLNASAPVNNVESRSRRNKFVNINLQSESVQRAVVALNNKEVIAYPTEAVFGVGCDPDSEVAVHRLLALKQRPVEKGLILIAASFEQLQPYIDDAALTQAQREAVFTCWPGPVTFVFPAKATTPTWLTGRFNSLAVRVTDHPVVIELCRAFGKPLVSTSANLTGLPPCRTTDEVLQQFGDDFPVVDAPTGGRLNPSEIRDALTGELFRQG
jgi:Putative translation factor (SUA5)